MRNIQNHGNKTTEILCAGQKLNTILKTLLEGKVERQITSERQ